jgi:hypothetical protein
MGVLRRWVRRPVTWVLAAVLVVAAGVAGAVFEPWKVFVDETVNDRLPVGIATGEPTPGGIATGEPTPGAPAGPGVLARGTFVSHEHDTSGRVVILRLADGRRVLRLEDLETSNGPDLRVWLTDARVTRGTAGWTVFDDGLYTEVGALKGNRGSQNYALPADLDLARYRSVTVWCRRFHVSFGAAELARA